ncbi:nucleotidyltransferase family protein [Commensalibacter oyaizuii]|uniref:Nucleotidyltransferase family protein n=1 Tax=Commensalibacter oyaizuii TaxID=3043873 RepID=A0ABT6Q1L9_9PROT|nr:nucleotidyltransferase family protein [Commensalibacter sp. TBRC 16381]MDI2091009.1 nucleotidyltransferase family protein [Commensalibacter sp. TBRC 16381]
MERETINALILAGSRKGQQDPLAMHTHVSHKAIIPILGRPMIHYVAQTLSKIVNIEKIAVSIEKPVVVQDILPEYIQYLSAALGPSASVVEAIQTLNTPLLVTTADNPLLQPEWVNYFLAEAEKANCDIAIGIALKEQIERDVPNTKRTYIKLADGAFSGCNIFLFRTPQSIQVAKLWQTLEQHRKQPAKIGYLLGYKIILRYLLRCLTRQVLKKRIYKLTKAKLHFVVMPWGQAAVDVDKPEDLALVTSLIHS